MGSYRLELASTSRAGCQNKECKDAKVKIQKGELRMGSWVDSERIQAFMWRHWGCTTPKLIANLNSTMEEEGSGGDEKDYNAIDGYEELPEDMQEKVRSALEQGHVDDEDWKGDVEMNRPGKNGFRVRGGKKDDAAEGKGEEEKEAPKSTNKKRTKAQAEDEAEKPAKAKKAAPRSKKAAKKEESGSEDDAEEEEAEEPKKPAKKARTTKGTADKAEKPAPSSRPKRKSASAVNYQEEGEEENNDDEKEDEEPQEKLKAKRGGRKKAT